MLRDVEGSRRGSQGGKEVGEPAVYMSSLKDR